MAAQNAASVRSTRLDEGCRNSIGSVFVGGSGYQADVALGSSYSKWVPIPDAATKRCVRSVPYWEAQDRLTWLPAVGAGKVVGVR